MHPCIHPSLHPSIAPSILSVHPFIPHTSIQLPIHSSTIHSLSIQPPSIIYHACIYPPAIIHSSLSIRSCTIYPCIQDLPIYVPSIHCQSSVYPSSHHSTTILLYGSVHPSILPSTHSSTYPSAIHFSIHYLSIIYLLSTLRGPDAALPSGSPQSAGGGAGRQCAPSPRCPHLESSRAGSVACRAGKGSRVQRPQAGCRGRAESQEP